MLHQRSRDVSMLSPQRLVHRTRVRHHRRRTPLNRGPHKSIPICRFTPHRDKHIPAPHAPRVIRNIINVNRRPPMLYRT